MPPINHFILIALNRKSNISTETDHDSDVLTEEGHFFHLVVWNDDINTFECVTTTLIEVCKHENEQSKQCTMFIHFKGKYTGKEGDYDTLKAMCNSITERGIGATVETSVA